MSSQLPDYVQRTALAWTRTALTLAVVSAVVARLAALDRSWAALAVAAVGLALAVATLLAVGRRRGTRPVTVGALMAVVAVACTGVATVILVVVS